MLNNLKIVRKEPEPIELPIISASFNATGGGFIKVEESTINKNGILIEIAGGLATFNKEHLREFGELLIKIASQLRE